MNKTKMTFMLDKDDDGYPPDDSETLWVQEVDDGNYRIDNIPFYVRGISPDDVVSGKFENGILFFSSIIDRSSISVIRVIFFEKNQSARVLSEIVDCGCRWEGSHLQSLYSIEVPNSHAYGCIEKILKHESDNEVLDYEEASLR